MELTLSLVELWTKQAGEIVKMGWGKTHAIGYKTDSDLVTEIDRQTEEFLVNLIQTHFPEHSIIGEENGHQAGNPVARWIIDPVDGTTNYAHGLPYFCVSVAFVDAEGTKFGVIYDPVHAECFTAERGKGAFLNGQPIHVSETQELKRAMLVTGFSHNQHEHVDRNLELFAEMNEASRAMRRLGSAALNMANVAAGRMDGYWELLVKPWDIAAGLLIVREAGGMATRIDGSDDLLTPPCTILVCPPALHAELMERISL